MNKDYAKLGFIANYTGLHVSEVEKVLQYALKYEDMNQKKEKKGSREQPLDIGEIIKSLKKPEQPPIGMTCMNCEHKERSHFGRIKSCPECNGVLVDVWEKDILNKVLENAGYVRVKDMNVNTGRAASYTSYGIDYAKPE